MYAQQALANQLRPCVSIALGTVGSAPCDKKKEEKMLVAPQSFFVSLSLSLFLFFSCFEMHTHILLVQDELCRRELEIETCACASDQL